MTTGNSFGGLSLKSSDEKVATITAGAGAANGSFNLVVTQLASASKVSTKVYAGGATSVVNAGTSTTKLTITQNGKAHDVSIPPGQRCKMCVRTSTASTARRASVPTS
jgi:flagellar hook-associated protein 2